MKSKLLIIPIAIALFSGCKKDDDDSTTPVVDQKQLEKNIINDFADFVVNPNYTELNTKADLLRTQVSIFVNFPLDSNLNNLRDAWRNVREPWERCEAFLFGPVEDFEYDPKIDTWPLNAVDMDALLASPFPPTTASDIEMLDFSLKGFHAIEYVIFGTTGNKTASQVTGEEMLYLNALTENLYLITSDLRSSWLPSTGDFTSEWKTAGAGSGRFATRRDALVALVTAMSGICDEVGGGKMEEPFAAQDSMLQESQFSHNSTTDFRNNMIGVRNAYFGSFTTDGHGLNELVALKNASLDQKIQTQITNVINGFNQIDSNYGLAIYTQATQIQQEQAAIEELKTTLEDELIPAIQVWVTE